MTSGDQRWRELTQSAAEAAGFDLEEFSVVNAGRRRMVRVIIDSDAGVSLDAAAALSRELSTIYDDAEQSGELNTGSQPYTLEVTSPGIGRPLTEARHFRRAAGRLVSITTAAGPKSGYVLGITDDGVDLVPVGGDRRTESVPFAEIVKAKVEVDFGGPSAAIAALLDADPRSAAARAQAAGAQDSSAEDASAEVASAEDASAEDASADDTSAHDDSVAPDSGTEGEPS